MLSYPLLVPPVRSLSLIPSWDLRSALTVLLLSLPCPLLEWLGVRGFVTVLYGESNFFSCATIPLSLPLSESVHLLDVFSSTTRPFPTLYSLSFLRELLLEKIGSLLGDGDFEDLEDGLLAMGRED